MLGAPCNPWLTLYGQVSPSPLQGALASPHRCVASGLERSRHPLPWRFEFSFPYKVAGEAGERLGVPAARGRDRRCRPAAGARSARSPSCCCGRRRGPPVPPRVSPSPLPRGTSPRGHAQLEGTESGRMTRQAGRWHASLKVFPLPEPPPWLSACHCQYLKLGD